MERRKRKRKERKEREREREAKVTGKAIFADKIRGIGKKKGIERSEQ